MKSQDAAARLRLRRELARTLRCFGSGDPNALLNAQIARETGSQGRYHRALAHLGGFPAWTPEEIGEATAYANSLPNNQRQSRINLGSELEAAVNDPRWRADSGDK